MLESVRLDVIYAVRLLRRTPAFSAAAALMLALGIGVNTAVFSVVNAAVLRPWPVRGGDRMVVIAAQDPGSARLVAFSFNDLEPYRVAALDEFEDIAAYSVGFLGVSSGDGPPSRVLVTWVTGNYFSLLDLRPAHGRFVAPEEVRDGRTAPVAVLGHSAWRSRFGADPAVVGSILRVNGRPCTIVGVAPEGFRGTFAFSDPEVYLPLNWSSGHLGAARGLHAFARLRNDVTIESAQAAMDVVSERIRSQRSQPALSGVRVVPERLARPEEDQFRSNRAWVSLLLMLVMLVLGVACINVTNLLIARAAGRATELAIRSALGASRLRLIRQMVTEAALLSGAGGIAGVLSGAWAANLLAGVRLPGDLPVRFDFSLDARVLAYAVGATSACALFVGLTAAWRATAVNPDRELRRTRGRSRGGAGQRLREALVIVQIGASFVLLTAAMLTARSLLHAERADLGFRADGVLNLHMDVGQLDYPESRGRTFFADVERAVRVLPGVERVSYAFTVPMGYIRVTETLEIEGSPGSRHITAGKNVVGAEYFETLGIPLVRGRGFTAADDERSRPVVVVNERFAAMAWPGQTALGRRLRPAGNAGPWSEVIGVARNGKYAFLFEDPLQYVYTPIAQQYSAMRVLHVRTSPPPDTLAGSIQRLIHDREPDLPLYDVQSMTNALGGGPGFFLVRVSALSTAAVALLGVVLALAGIYALVAYLTGRRTREIGVRVALGATPRDILKLVLRDGLQAVVPGITTGALIAALAAPHASRFLFSLSPFDPLTYAVVAPTLVTLTLLAGAIPAAGAMRINPAEALHTE